MRIPFLFALLYLTSACAHSRTASDPAPRGAQATSSTGSCTHDDPTTNGGDFCSETESQYGGPLCQAARGAWSSTKCAVSKYARRCVTIGRESVNDGPLVDVKETIYTRDDSDLGCLGKESKVAEGQAEAGLYPTTGKNDALREGIQVMTAADLQSRLDSLSSEDASAGQEVIWGGTIGKGKRSFAGPTFDLAYRDVVGVEFVPLAFATIDACVETVGLGVTYNISGEHFGDFTTHPNYLGGGVLDVMTGSGGPPSRYSPPVGGAATVKTSVNLDKARSVQVDCPFIASFMVKVETE